MSDFDLARAVARAFYGRDAAVERLPAANHIVFRLDLADGARVVKLARSADDAGSIRKELHVLALLASHGIPVPVVEHADPEGRHAGRPCFAMRSAGVRTVLDALRGPAETAADLFHQMGAVLSAIHHVSLPASGDIQPDGTIVARDRSAWLARIHALADWAAETGGLPRTEVARFRALPMPAIEGRAMCHGDFHAVQCVVQAGRLSAVVDWHEAWAGNQVIDLGIAHGYLEFYSSPSLVDAFLRGYTGAEGPAPEYERASLPVRMAHVLALLRASHAQGHTQSVRRAAELFVAYSGRWIE